MNFEHSPRTEELLARLSAFQEQEIEPREEAYSARSRRALTRGPFRR